DHAGGEHRAGLRVDLGGLDDDVLGGGGQRRGEEGQGGEEAWHQSSLVCSDCIDPRERAALFFPPSPGFAGEGPGARAASFHLLSSFDLIASHSCGCIAFHGVSRGPPTGTLKRNEIKTTPDPPPRPLSRKAGRGENSS